MKEATTPLHVLLVDDDINICRTMALGLKQLDCTVITANSVSSAVEILQTQKFDLILSDYRMGESTGSDLIKESAKVNPKPLIAIMTAFASIENAIEVTRDGAFDYLPKPFTQSQLSHLLKKVRMIVALKKENEDLRSQKNRSPLFFGMTSLASESLATFVKKVAPSDATVLLTGESGTGKSEIARYIHKASNRANKPFVVVNCTSLAESLLESEIFGHVKGAFTGATQDKVGKFELAHHGTLFLDEIGDLSLDAQSRLLRFLQEKVIERVGGNQTISIDARVIAATNKDIEKAVTGGAFREDLFYRLNVFEFTMVPLRHRKEDVPILIKQFASEFSSGKPLTFSADALDALYRYPWPGNIRELRNLLERLSVLNSQSEITLQDLPAKVVHAKQLTESSPDILFSLEEAEKRHILEVLAAEPNLDKASEILGITKVTLWRRRKEYGIQ
jgi:DNA-binding NtrC family response regulator